MKKFLSVVLTIIMLIMPVVQMAVFALPSEVAVSDSATEQTDSDETATLAASSGICGTNLTWTLDDAGTLTISGTGAMKDWTDELNVPWHSSAWAIKKVVIGDKVTSIGKKAFYNCYNLSSVTIGNGVKSIGNYAFEFCESLVSANIPDSVTSIGSNAFYSCESLVSINIQNGVTSIGNSAFEYCESLVSINIPDSVTSIENSAFYHCESLVSVNVPNSVTSIGNFAFYSCKSLEKATIPASVTSIGVKAFSYCNKLTIHCYTNTAAKAYADANEIPFVIIDTENIISHSFSTSMQAYLNLEGLISMSVGYKFSDMDSINPEAYTDNVGLLVWEADEAPEQADATYENCSYIIEGARYNSVLGRFESTTEGIVAKKLGDALSFRPYYVDEDGNYTYGRYITNYSPKTYCYNQIRNNSDDEATVELMASILNYGAAAQKYFDYRTDDLMNADLPEELK